jgi:hypothetical protein
MLPRLVYETLPYAYITSGAVGLIYGGSALLLLSALLMSSTGVWICRLRFKYRLARQRAIKRRLEWVQSLSAHPGS